MPDDDAPRIEPGRGRLVYDKERRTIVSQLLSRRNDDLIEPIARAIAQHFYEPDDWNSQFSLGCARAALDAIESAGYLIFPRPKNVPREAIVTDIACSYI